MQATRMAEDPSRRFFRVTMSSPMKSDVSGQKVVGCGTAGGVPPRVDIAMEDVKRIWAAGNLIDGWIR
jgi:hypothetical protein